MPKIILHSLTHLYATDHDIPVTFHNNLSDQVTNYLFVCWRHWTISNLCLPWALGNIWHGASFAALPSWLPDNTFFWLSLPFWSLLTPLLWELLPRHLPLLRRWPSGGHPRPASLFMPRDLLLLGLQTPADYFQIFSSSPDISPKFPGICPHAYWYPQLDKLHTPKFHYVHNRVRHLPPRLFLLGLLSKCRALQQPNCSGQKPENCTSLLHLPKENQSPQFINSTS